MVDTGLLIKRKWLDKILYDEKRIEIRGTKTKPKRIALIASREKNRKIYGYATIKECISLTKEFVDLNSEQTGGVKWSDIEYKNVYGWILSDIILEEIPVSIPTTRGPVIFVKL